MPEFFAGESKIARATMRNPTSKAFSYEAALIVGLPEAARAEASFAIPALGEKVVAFPVTMPGLTGIYPVHIYITSEGNPVGTYRAVEDVSVVPPRLPFAYGTPSASWRYAAYASAWREPVYSIPITNSNPQMATRVVSLVIQRISGTADYSETTNLTLAPGETVTFIFNNQLPGYPVGYYKNLFGGDDRLKIYMEDDAGGRSIDSFLP